MALNWNVSILAQPSNPSNWLVAAIYDASAPSVLVDSIPLPKPYGSTKNITFMGLDNIVYDFKLFESTTTAPVGTVLNTFSFQPALGTITNVREDLYLTADISPDFPSNPERTLYQDDSLVGWLFEIERVGMGTLEKGLDYQLTLDGAPEDSTAANGWQLLREGDMVGDQERFVIHFLPQVQSSASGSGSGGSNMIAGSVVLDADITLDNTYFKKACLLQGSGVDHFTVTLPPLLTTPDNQMIGFISAGGDHVNVTLDGDGSDLILFNGLNENIILGQSEQVWLFKANSVWNVAFPEGNFKTVGEIVMHYITDELNSVFANGVLLSRTANARLWKFVNALPSSLLIDDSQWNNTVSANGRTVFVNRGKFTRGDGSTTFRVPIIYAVGNLKAVDGSTRLAGSFEADQVGQFDLTITGKVIKKGGNSNVIVGLGVPSGPVSGANPDPTFGDYDIPVGTINSTKENKQANIGVYALIRS